MTTIANIDINLRATTESLDGDLTKGKKKVKDAVDEISSIQKVGKVASPLTGMFDVSTLPVVGQTISAFTEASGAAGAFSVAGVAAGAAVAGAVAIVAAGALAASYAIGKISAEMEEIDRVSDRAKSLGLAFAELTTLEESLAETSGLDTGAIDASIQKLELNLAEAASTGKGAAADALGKLGLDATELIQQGPMEAIASISDAIQGLENPTEQLAASFDLFGKSGAMLVSSLREGPDAIAEMNQFLDGFGVNVSDQQAEQVGAANDAWHRLELIATGIWRQIAAEASPVLAAIYDSILEAADGIAGWHIFLPKTIDYLTQMAGGLYDIGELTSFISKTLYNIVTMNFASIGEGLKEAFTFDTGQKWLDRINEQRGLAAQKVDEGGVNHEAALTGIEQQREAAKEAAKKAEENRKAEAKLMEDRKKAADAEAKALASKRDNIVEENRVLLEQLKQMKAGVKVIDTKSIKEFFDLGLDHIKGPFRDSVLAAQAERRQLEQSIKDMDDAKAVKDAQKTPAQKFEDEILKLTGLYNKGLIDRSVLDKAARESASTNLPGMASLVSTATAGSSEAYKAIAGIKQEDNYQRQIAEKTDRQIDIAQQTLNAMRTAPVLRRAR